MQDNVSRVVVLRANALGDYIFTLPALHALKARWPKATLIYLGTAWHKQFIESRPGPVDRVIVVPKCDGIPHESDRAEDEQRVEAFFADMRAEKFDLALQMHGGGGNSNPFVRRLCARRTVGLRSEDAPALDVNVPYVLYQNEVLRYLEVASAAGAPPVTVEPHVEVTDSDRDELAAAVPDLARPYVVLHPGASDLRRRWPTAKLAALADVLHANGYNVYVTGTQAEGPLVDDVVRHACAAQSLCGRLSLAAMTALLEGAHLVVSNDTGPLHLARAVGSATIGIYWVGNVINAGPMTTRKHRYAMAWTTHCPKCGMDCIRYDAHVPREGCAHDTSFVEAVRLENIVSLAEELLGQPLSMQQLAAM